MLDADIDKGQVELDHAHAAAGSFGRNQGRAGAAERVKDQVAAVGACFATSSKDKCVPQGHAKAHDDGDASFVFRLAQ